MSIRAVREENTGDIQWVRSLKPNPQAVLRLFCFPYAGGSDLTFRTWPLELPAGVEVCGIQLPGHGNRLREPLIDRMEPLVAALTPMLVPYLDRPFAFFGHSMGAMIGFELAHRLRRQHGLEPIHLFVSGRCAPQTPVTEPPTYNLPEPQLLEELRRLNGTPKEVFEQPELLKLMIPLMRTDFELCQTYAHSPEPPLNCPITVFGGLEDHDTPQTDLEAWRTQTTGAFRLYTLPGDHFFIHSSQPFILQVISQELQAALKK